MKKLLFLSLIFIATQSFAFEVNSFDSSNTQNQSYQSCSNENSYDNSNTLLDEQSFLINKMCTFEKYALFNERLLKIKSTLNDNISNGSSNLNQNTSSGDNDFTKNLESGLDSCKDKSEALRKEIASKYKINPSCNYVNQRILPFAY